jgi:hypothetical protein
MPAIRWTIANAHLPGARRAIRPRLTTLLPELPSGKRVVLYAEHETQARLAAIDLKAMTDVPIAVLDGGRAAWTAAERPLESSPDTPPDAACIDFLFFVHDRHQGNQQAMRVYLSWEEPCPRRSRRTATPCSQCGCRNLEASQAFCR